MTTAKNNMADLDKFDPEDIDDEGEYEDLSGGERKAAEEAMRKRDQKEGRPMEKVLSLKRKSSDDEKESEDDEEEVPLPMGKGDSKKQTTLFSFFTRKSKPNSEGGSDETVVSVSKLKAEAEAKSQSELIKKLKKGGKSGGISPGTLVWAKLTGYPWWPALICQHPRKKIVKRKCEGQVQFHIQFLGEAYTDWVAKSMLIVWGEELDEVDRTEGEKDEAWREGVKLAEGAAKWSEEKRLALLLKTEEEDNDSDGSESEEEEEEVSCGARQAAEAAMRKRDEKEGRPVEKVLSLKRKSPEEEEEEEQSEDEEEPEQKQLAKKVKKGGKPSIPPGSLVWAKLTGYPWWPSVVCDHPKREISERKFQGQVEVHVWFLGEQNRDWVARSLLRLWGDGPDELEKAEAAKHKAWREGLKEAEGSVEWSNEKRLGLLLKTEEEEEEDGSNEEGESSPEKKVKSPAKKRRRIVMMESEDSESETEAFEVEKILDKRVVEDVIEYFIKWVGFDKEEDNTWEPVGNLDCSDKIQLFEATLANDSKLAENTSKTILKLAKEETEDKKESAGAC